MERTPNKGKGLLDEPTEVARIGEDFLAEYDVAPGTLLGDYVIERPLGHGGMGDVFAAVHPTIGKRAAVKVIKKELSNQFNVQRFQDEARVVNAIGHPNIVDIFAFGEMPDGRCFYIMELLVGQTLRERIAAGPISPEETCAILKPLTRALEAAHAKGVIHRDLKPDNVFLVDVPGEQPIIKLLDFGIAKLAKTDHRIEQTKSGVMVGTPQYVAPEQAKGHAVDARADIYALGGITFEMLTGRPPFVADNAMEMVAKHLMEQPVTPSSVIDGIPPELDTLVLAMLAKDPAQRPALSDVALVIERMKSSVSLEDVSTFRRGETDQPRPVVRPLSTPAPGAVVAAMPSIRSADSEVFAADPRSGAHTSVDPVVTADHTEQDAVEIPPSRGKYIVLGVVLLGAAMLVSFLVIRSLKSKSSDPGVAVDALAVESAIDAPPEIDQAPAVAADAALDIDAAVVAVDAAVVSVDAAVTIVDAAPVIADAAVAAADARVQTPPPPPQPRKGRFTLELQKGLKNVVIKVDGKVVGRELPVVIGQTYKVEISADGFRTARFTFTATKPVGSRSVTLEPDLM